MSNPPLALLLGTSLAASLFARSERALACSNVTGQHGNGFAHHLTHIRVIRYIWVPFHVRGARLAIVTGTLEHNVLVHPIRWVFLVSPSRKIPIDSYDDLRGHVSIDSPQNAVAYVRLNTSYKMRGVFGNFFHGVMAWEVVDRREVTSSFTLGDEVQADLLQRTPNMELGVVDAGYAKAQGIPLIRCKPQAGGYEVTRTLLMHGPEDSRGNLPLMRVVEWVGKDGQYILKGQKVFRYVPYPWMTPSLM